jgi:hypothetical protein
MTVFEILNFNRETLTRIKATGFKLNDCRFINMYSEYEQMMDKGDKVTYIVSVLSDKYEVSERKVYTLVKFFKKAA